jgi:hypothetical protein
MDLLAELREKLSGLATHARVERIRAAIRHIEIAEKYLERGRNEEDPETFNDVIYRTNQAFEGMLKEAYAVLSATDGETLSPHQIEQHLAKEKTLTDRVQGLFANYRPATVASCPAQCPKVWSPPSPLTRLSRDAGSPPSPPKRGEGCPSSGSGR